MDDNTKLGKAYFPLLDTEVLVRQPSEGQVLVLMNLRPDKGGAGRAVRRIMAVLETLVSPGDWTRIEDALVDESLTVSDFFAFAEEIMRFDWNGDEPVHGPQPEPEPERRAPRRA